MSIDVADFDPTNSEVTLKVRPDSESWKTVTKISTVSWTTSISIRKYMLYKGNFR